MAPRKTLRVISAPYPIEASVNRLLCLKHSRCVEYSVIPHDPTQPRYEIHSSVRDSREQGLTLQMVRTIFNFKRQRGRKS
jgi:hypothetical protein